MLSLLTKYFLVLGVCLSFACCTSINNGSNGKVSLQKSLIVGLQSGYPPFEYKDKAGKIVGFDVDLAECIAAKLSKKLVIKDMEFEGEILSLKQGKIDVIISGMNITPSRLNEILMVPYHGDAASNLSLIFWNTIPNGIQSIEDVARLPGVVISAEAGSTSEAFMNNYPDIQVRSFEGSLSPLMDVKYGKSIANIVEADVAEYLKSQHKEISILKIPLTKEAAILGFGIGIKKENQELYDQIEKIIGELRTSGEMKQLENKWFGGNT